MPYPFYVSKNIKNCTQWFFKKRVGKGNGNHDNIVEFIHKLKNNFKNKKVETWVNKVQNLLDGITKLKTSVFQSYHSTPYSFMEQSIGIVNKLDKILDIRKRIILICSSDKTEYAIKNHIQNTCNYLTIGYLWFYLRKSISDYTKEIFCNRVYDILSEDVRKKKYGNSCCIMIFSDVLSSWGKKASAECPKIYDLSLFPLSINNFFSLCCFYRITYLLN